MLEATITFNLFCAKCREMLSVSPMPDGSGTRFLVKMCEPCRDKEYGEGLDAGYAEGFTDGEEAATSDD